MPLQYTAQATLRYRLGSVLSSRRSCPARAATPGAPSGSLTVMVHRARLLTPPVANTARPNRRALCEDTAPGRLLAPALPVTRVVDVVTDGQTVRPAQGGDGPIGDLT